MTQDRWLQIDNLFDTAIRLDPAEREEWLRRACGDDDDLMAKVGQLLAEDDGATRDGFLAPLEVRSRPSDETASWPPRDGRQPPGRAGSTSAEQLR